MGIEQLKRAPTLMAGMTWGKLVKILGNIFSKDETISLIKIKGSKVGLTIHKTTMSEGGDVITQFQDYPPKKVA